MPGSRPVQVAYRLQAARPECQNISGEAHKVLQAQGAHGTTVPLSDAALQPVNFLSTYCALCGAEPQDDLTEFNVLQGGFCTSTAAQSSPEKIWNSRGASEKRAVQSLVRPFMVCPPDMRHLLCRGENFT